MEESEQLSLIVPRLVDFFLDVLFLLLFFTDPLFSGFQWFSVDFVHKKWFLKVVFIVFRLIFKGVVMMFHFLQTFL